MEETAQPFFECTTFCVTVFLHVGGFHPNASKPRCHDKGYSQRQQHAHACIDWNWAHVRPHQTRHKRHGQQSGNHSESGQDGGRAHFVHSARNDLGQCFVWEQGLVAVDVLHHHDSVVHQDADGENQRKQGHAVERETPCPRGKQRDRQGQDHSRAHDGGFTTTQSDEHQGHHRGGGKQQFLNQLLGFVIRGFAIVARGGDFNVLWNLALLECGHLRQHSISHLNGVFAGLLGNSDGHCGAFVRLSTCHAMPHCGVGLCATIAHLGNVMHMQRRTCTHAHHQTGHIFGTAQERARLNGDGLLAYQ